MTIRLYNLSMQPLQLLHISVCCEVYLRLVLVCDHKLPIFRTRHMQGL